MPIDSDKEWLIEYKRVHEGSWIEAFKSVKEMNLPKTLELPNLIHGLSPRANEQYARSYDILRSECGSSLSAVFAFAQWIMWASCWDGAHWFRRSIENGHIGDNEYCRGRCTPTGYAETEGWAYTVFNKVSEFDFEGVLKEITKEFDLSFVPCDRQILCALQLRWLNQACAEDIDRHQLIDLMHEAGEASALENGLGMYSAGEKSALETLDQANDSIVAARKALAKAAAEIRHAPNKALKEQVISRFRTERAKYNNKDNAAIAYTKDYPLEFTTIRTWLKNV